MNIIITIAAAYILGALVSAAVRFKADEPAIPAALLWPMDVWSVLVALWQHFRHRK